MIKTLFLLAMAAMVLLIALVPAMRQAAKSFGYDLAYRLHVGATRLMWRTGMVMGVTYYSAEQGVINGPQFGQPLNTRIPSSKLGGRLRIAELFFVVPAGTLQIGDKIVWGKMPLKSKLIPHLCKMIWTAGTASSTLNLGDAIQPARHLAATAVNAAGSAVPIVSEQANVSAATTVNGSNVITVTAGLGAPFLGNLIAGTGIPANTTVTGISQNAVGTLSVTMSSAATASNAGVAITFTGDGYLHSDDSNNLQNGFGSTTDDATLVSVVAGAVLAAGQVITLKLVYAQD